MAAGEGLGSLGAPCGQQQNYSPAIRAGDNRGRWAIIGAEEGLESQQFPGSPAMRAIISPTE